jgi:hypothetical protein
MTGPTGGGTMRSGARLSRWHFGKLAPSGGRFCRPRCYAPFSPAHGQGCPCGATGPRSRHKRIPLERAG